MPSGGARPGAGRPKGAANKMQEAARQKAAEGGLTPLEYMLQILRDEGLDRLERFEAAKAAAPYLHAKLASTELNANVRLGHEDSLEHLDDEPEGAGGSEALA